MQEYFAIIEDPRYQGFVKHKLSDILTIVTCAVLCGMDRLCDIMAYAENKKEFFRIHFGIEKIPSKPTISRTLAVIDGQKVAESILAMMQDAIGIKGDLIAVDGKAIRSTSPNGKPHAALQVITAYLTECGVVLGQEKIHEKTNEIPVFQKMMSYLNVKGKTVTADAMHCQRNTCSMILNQGGDYLFGLKENQKTLHDDVELFFKDCPDNAKVERFSTTEKNGGRVEKRICKKVDDVRWLQELHNWPGLRAFFSMERIVTVGGKTTREMSYYITSADTSAKQLLAFAREHWAIESLHWSLDVVFSEDSSRFLSENAHLCLNALRKYALAVHKKYLAEHHKKCSVKRHLTDCLLNEQLLLQLISITRIQ
jgi:predicted transposase YbfD/YdcC